MLENYYKRFIGKKAWLLDEKYNLVTDKVYSVIGVEMVDNQWGTKSPKLLLRFGTETIKANPDFAIYTPDEALDEEARIARYLSDNDVFAEEVYFTFHDGKELSVTINNGDWKHSHNRADWLMGEIGYALLNRINCGEDTDDDNYSAIHIYVKENNNE